MTMPFTPGQRVRALREFEKCRLIRKGEVYTVARVGKSSIELLGLGEGRWPAVAFEPEHK